MTVYEHTYNPLLGKTKGGTAIHIIGPVSETDKTKDYALCGREVDVDIALDIEDVEPSICKQCWRLQ